MPEASPYWEGARAGVLRLQRCRACGAARFYPRHLCPDCGDSSVSWFDASGWGVVYTFTIVHRGPSPAFRERQPYVVALVDLDEGPRLMTNIVGGDALEVAIGDRVQVRFEDRGEHVVPVFARAT